jgi:hypothetical protein
VAVLGRSVITAGPSEKDVRKVVSGTAREEAAGSPSTVSWNRPRTAVMVAALLLSAVTLVGILIGAGFLGLAVFLMFPPIGFRNGLRS